MNATESERVKPVEQEAVEYIYITGTRHSGSTVFGSALAVRAGCAFPGEIHYVARAIEHDEFCACGEQASVCSFWRPIVHWWHTNAELQAPGDYEHVRRRRESIRAALFGGWAGRAARQEQRRYAHTTGAILAALRRAYGVSTLIDSSKSLGRLLQLLRMGGGREMLVIHLVRDPLAVAASSRTPRSADPARGLERTVGGHIPWRTAVSWTLGNLAIAVVLRLARPFGVRTKRVRYEQFAARPLDEFAHLGFAAETSAEVSVQPPHVPVPMARQHVLCGNYVRMQGDTQLRAPAPRIDELTPAQRRAVRLISMPIDRALT